MGQHHTTAATAVYCDEVRTPQSVHCSKGSRMNQDRCVSGCTLLASRMRLLTNWRGILVVVATHIEIVAEKARRSVFQRGEV
jgi:hypothetical protein